MSGQPRLSDEAEFIELIRTKGIAGTARALGITTGSVYERRERIEKRTGRAITVPDWRNTRPEHTHPGRLHFEIEDGVVLIGSDAHYWPGIITPAHRAFVRFCKELKPKAVIKNGDAFDGASVSRHPPIGWEHIPTVQLELEACKDRMGEIVTAAGKAKRFWPLGNHDARFETRLATEASEYANVHGFHLKDHLADWSPCWSVQINSNTIVKHRFKGGIHATHNNTVNAGWNIFTGHLHSLKVTPFTDYTGTRFGGDTGTMAEPFGPQFEYMEDNARNWRSGFIVLTFHKGRLLWPEVVHVLSEDEVEFRGQVLKV